MVFFFKIYFILFNSVLCPFQDYFISYEMGQSVGDDLNNTLNTKNIMGMRLQIIMVP